MVCLKKESKPNTYWFSGISEKSLITLAIRLASCPHSHCYLPVFENICTVLHETLGVLCPNTPIQGALQAQPEICSLTSFIKQREKKLLERAALQTDPLHPWAVAVTERERRKKNLFQNCMRSWVSWTSPFSASGVTLIPLSCTLK